MTPVYNCTAFVKECTKLKSTHEMKTIDNHNFLCSMQWKIAQSTSFTFVYYKFALQQTKLEWLIWNNKKHHLHHNSRNGSSNNSMVLFYVNQYAMLWFEWGCSLATQIKKCWSKKKYRRKKQKDFDAYDERDRPHMYTLFRKHPSHSISYPL